MHINILIHYIMKTRTHILSIFLLVFACQLSHGQFLKKLKKKAEQAVEEVVVRKTADKAAQMAGKGMDKIFNINIGGAQVDPSILPSSYDFEWKYTMQMKHKRGNMNMTYYLKPGAKYFGSQAELENNVMANNMFMVFDEEINVLLILMETENGKAGHVLNNATGELEDIAEQEANSMKDYTFTEVGTKTILGYECQGFQMENEDLKMTMYIAMDAPVSFNQVYGGMQQQALPKGFDPKWLDKAENSIMMEMDIVNKKKKKHSAKMTCVALEKAPKTIVIEDYEFMSLDSNAGREN